MGLLTRLFGPTEPPPPPRDVMALALPLAQPALQLTASDTETGSFLGGTPPMSAATPWPSKDGAPLTFLACLDVASLQVTLPVAWLPASGRLLFFYDAENQPWGFDPKNRGSWAVMLADE